MIVGLVLRLSPSLFCTCDFIYAKLLFMAKEGESLGGYDHVRTPMTHTFSVHMRVQKNEKDSVLVGFWSALEMAQSLSPNVLTPRALESLRTIMIG